MSRVRTELDEEDMDEQLLAPLYWELHWRWRDGVRGSTVPWQQRSPPSPSPTRQKCRVFSRTAHIRELYPTAPLHVSLIRL